MIADKKEQFGHAMIETVFSRSRNSPICRRKRHDNRRTIPKKAFGMERQD
jgi:hypothetical protein